MLHLARIAVALAKSVFEIGVSDQPGRVVERHRLPRGEFLEFFANRPAATVVMEACGSAHFWARKIESLGHRVVLLPPRARTALRAAQQDRFANTIRYTGAVAHISR
jgi:transposase